ncbi:MAG: flagellar biosynthetic protein FliO [Pseudomonadota bacterium]|nr:MAG: flagellar biosynthetic protein FliO [Pseudomonadota bacterium]
MKAAAFLLGLVALPAAAQSAEAAPATPVGAMLQSLLALALVLAVIAGTAWLLRRIQRLPGSGNEVLRSVAAVAVGPKERVVVVEVGDTWLILGVAPGQVRTLHTLPRQAVNPASSGTPKFADWLARMRKGDERV